MNIYQWVLHVIKNIKSSEICFVIGRYADFDSLRCLFKSYCLKKCIFMFATDISGKAVKNFKQLCVDFPDIIFSQQKACTYNSEIIMLGCDVDYVLENIGKCNNMIIVFNYYECRCFDIFKAAYSKVHRLTIFRKKIATDETEKLDYINDNRPLISCILPVYNVGKYLVECIESIIDYKSSSTFIEFIFVDDGSTDNSAELISDYAKIDTRIKLIHKQNGGCASARQMGLEISTGLFVMFIDPDDFVSSSIFDKLLGRALCGNYDITFCGYKEYYCDGAFVSNNYHMANLLNYINGTCNENEIGNYIYNARGSIWATLFKRKLIVDNKLSFHTNIRRHDDGAFRIESSLCANSIASVPECLYYYRLGRIGQDVSCHDERLFVVFDICYAMDRFVMSHNFSNYRISVYSHAKNKNLDWFQINIDKKLLKEYKKRLRKYTKNIDKKLIV